MSIKTTRYDTNYNIKNRFDGKRYFGSRTYPIITPDNSDILYIANDADYLDTLAYKFYNDVSLWWIIALANNLGNGRLSVTGNTQLRIPTRVDEILSEYRKLNS